MDPFWLAAFESRKREKEEKAAAEKEAAEREKAKASITPAATPAAPAVITHDKVVTEPVVSPPTKKDSMDLSHPSSPHAKKKKKSKKPVVRRRGRRVSSSSSDSSIDDREVVTVGKHVSRIRDVKKAYPLFARRHKAAIQAGVRKMVEGEFDEHLTNKEKKSIAQKKRKYKKVARRSCNPFEDKYRKVGNTYKKFMSEISVKHMDTSSSSDSSASEMSE
jgi:hypothetical protein